ncbi:sensor histidine kinase [Mucilaginibacter flavus]|uniref:sensor histidine kinase n=1 Tax=Mucilaginibacter flavus TaxID=931504 RepID=UPI0025B5A3E2|nr:7TM diverse intracellular signaling domain-containing protein [Mucilaginibacter flavus]MDN3579288.1 7TM diverse intracellular signaling domain-containing protein [Mucilaginibacter flavus]
MKRLISLYAVPLLLCICLPRVCAAGTKLSQTDTLLVNDDDKLPLPGHIWFYEDKSLKIDINQAIVQRNKGAFEVLNKVTLSRGYTNSYYWVTFTLKNITQHTASLFFWQSSSDVSRMFFYELDGKQIKVTGPTGAHYPFKQRPVLNRAFLFNIVLKPGETKTYYVFADKVGHNLYMPMYLWKDTTVWQAEISNYTTDAFLAGVLLLAIVFNIFLYFSIKDKIHLFYCLYVLCSLIFFLEEQGHGFEWIYPSIPYLQDEMRPLVAALGNAFIIEIMQLFVAQTKKNGFFFYAAQTFKYVGYIVSPFIFAMLFFHPAIWMEQAVFYVVNLQALLSTVVVAGSAIQRMREGFRPAYFYFLAITPLLLGILNYIFNTLGITNFNLVRPNGLVVGSTLEIVLLALALTYRYNDALAGNKKLVIENSRLLEQVMLAEEEERNRLARDLHDDLGSTLATIKLNVTSFQNRIQLFDESLQSFYFNTVTLLTKACDDLRHISHNLMPPDFSKKGMVATLEEEIDQINLNQQIKFGFIADDAGLSFNHAFEIAMYRIFSELINNTLKHSGAAEAVLQYIVIKDKNLIRIVAEDDGKGFSANTTANTKGIGIKNISQRTRLFHGTVNIDSSHRGTTVIIELPFNHSNFKYEA